MTEPRVWTPATGEDATRRAALIALFLAIAAIAAGYAAAFSPAGTPVWAAWLLALGIPVALGAIMILGAARGRRGVGPLKIPFAFVVLVLVGFFYVYKKGVLEWGPETKRPGVKE